MLQAQLCKDNFLAQLHLLNEEKQCVRLVYNLWLDLLK